MPIRSRAFDLTALTMEKRRLLRLVTGSLSQTAPGPASGTAVHPTMKYFTLDEHARIICGKEMQAWKSAIFLMNGRSNARTR
jgi:hypothetical protein